MIFADFVLVRSWQFGWRLKNVSSLHGADGRQGWKMLIIVLSFTLKPYSWKSAYFVPIYFATSVLHAKLKWSLSH